MNFRQDAASDLNGIKSKIVEHSESYRSVCNVIEIVQHSMNELELFKRSDVID